MKIAINGNLLLSSSDRKDSFQQEQLLCPLRYHGRWIDSVWKSRSHADALKENPINLYIFFYLEK